MLLTLPGDCNEGSIAGSCLCNGRLSSPLQPGLLEKLRKLLNYYKDCIHYVRFHFHPKGKTVCGGSTDPWVVELKGCYDKRECGYTHFQSQSMVHQQNLPPSSNQVPETRPLSTSTPAQTSLSPSLQSSQQPTLPVATPSLDKNFTHIYETTTSMAGQSLGTALEMREKKKENEGSAAGTSGFVPVLSLLGIIFFLTIVLLYVICKRQQSQRNSPDLQLQYTPVAPDSTA